MITAAGVFRLEAVKLTSTDVLGYSSSLLTAGANGTLVTRLEVMTGTTQEPGNNQRVGIFLYSGSVYYEYASFNLDGQADAWQWGESPTDLVFPAGSSWAFRFAVRQSALLAGAELHFKAWGRDIS